MRYSRFYEYSQISVTEKKNGKKRKNEKKLLWDIAIIVIDNFIKVRRVYGVEHCIDELVKNKIQDYITNRKKTLPKLSFFYLPNEKCALI